MIDAARFQGFAAARLSYAVCVTPEEGETILAEMLADGSWEEAASLWIQRAWYLASKADGAKVRTEAEWLAAWAKVVIDADRLDDAVRGVLGGVVPKLVSLGQGAVLDELVAWFIARAGPGDAACAAQMLRALRSSEETTERLAPLVAWMVELGGGELRARGGRGAGRDPWLLTLMIRAAVESKQAGLFAPLLRHLILSDSPMVQPEEVESLWIAVEGALRGGAPMSLATDLVAVLHGFASPWGDLFGEGWPMARDAIFDGLCAGVLQDYRAKDGWATACARPAPRELVFPTRPAALSTLESLTNLSWEQPGADAEGRLIGWWAAAARGVIVLHNGDLAEAARELTPFRSVGGSATAFGAALDEAVPKESPDPVVRLARAILDEQRGSPYLAYSVLELLGDARPKAPAARSVELDRVAEDLTRLVAMGWEHPVAGVDLRRLLGRATRVELQRLPDDEKVVVDGTTVRADEWYFRHIVEQRGYGPETQALAALYFFHELVHHGQGIGDFQNVRAIRAIGAESTLMHVDLAADNVAILLAAKARPSWDVLTLRELASASLAEFPTSRFHSQASRLRKAYRFVSARLDYLARLGYATRLAGRDGGYLFAEFGLSGDCFLIFGSGPPIALLGRSSIQRADIETLYRSVEPTPKPREVLASVDAILQGVLARASWPG